MSTASGLKITPQVTDLMVNYGFTSTRGVMDEFREWLETRLKEKGMRQSKLAELSGINKQTINKWLRSEPPSQPTEENLERIYKHLDVDLDTLRVIAGYAPQDRSNLTIQVLQHPLFKRLEEGYTEDEHREFIEEMAYQARRVMERADARKEKIDTKR